jgi:hypothetical protein
MVILHRAHPKHLNLLYDEFWRSILELISPAIIDIALAGTLRRICIRQRFFSRTGKRMIV